MNHRHTWITRFVKDFENNPRKQFRFHSIMMRFWELNVIAGILLIILAPSIWISVGVFYVFIISLYSNWDTDLDSLAATKAAIHGEDILKQTAKDS